MIDLSQAELIGRGRGRVCYRHPENPNLLIKVARPEGDARAQNHQEALFLGTLVRRGVPFDHLPHWVGLVETNLGEGLVCEVIADSDGRPSRALPRAMTEGVMTRAEVDRSVTDLYDYLYRHGITLGDTVVGNLLWQVRPGHPRIVLIDGIGARRLGFKATLQRTVPTLARLALRRQWPRLLANMDEELPAV